MSKRKTRCKWWLNCKNEATTTQAHPTLGDVPICQRCKDKVARLGGITATEPNSEEKESKT